MKFLSRFLVTYIVLDIVRRFSGFDRSPSFNLAFCAAAVSFWIIDDVFDEWKRFREDVIEKQIKRRYG